MNDIASHRLLFAKAILFVVLGALAGGLLIASAPQLKTIALLAICVWAFARAYYFAFYVIEKYVDSTFRFRGLWSVVVYTHRKIFRPIA
ncbi:MAG TPA: hypothetical protein VMU84_11785 [Thermoanaerobaculia bacterium]|nr:hypothetical protein [Thermoanaerobaculia bacterium]